MALIEFPWAYVGPDVILPFASVLAAILGVIMIAWRFILTAIRRTYYFVLGKNPPVRKFEDIGETPPAPEAISPVPAAASTEPSSPTE